MKNDHQVSEDLFDRATLNLLIGKIEGFFHDVRDELRQQRNLMRLIAEHNGINLSAWKVLEKQAKEGSK